MDDEGILHEEDHVSEETSPTLVAAARSSMTTWTSMVEANSGVRVRTLTFVEPLPSRTVMDVLPAIARIHARLRSLGLQVLRLHCDRARGLISGAVRRWTLDRQILMTLTSGDSYKSNGRAEGEVSMVKKSMRTIIGSNGALRDWPRPFGQTHWRAPIASAASSSWMPHQAATTIWLPGFCTEKILAGQVSGLASGP